MAGQKEEIEQALLEAQDRVITTRQSLQQTNTHIQLVDRERRRTELTKKELEQLDVTHNVYRTVGRMFVLTPVEKLRKELGDRNSMCAQELVKLGERKSTAEVATKDAEQHFKQCLDTYRKLQETTKE